MDQVKTLFREGVMCHLEQLEALSRTLAGKQEQRRREEEEQEGRREEILTLEKEREELRTHIQLQRKQIRALQAQRQRSLPAEHSTQEVLQNMRLEEMQSIMEALWFTGISGKKTDNGVCFCISTAFEGTYLDTYHLQVDNLERPRIGRHSVPSFVPLERIAQEHLPGDLKTFLSALHGHLNGYAGRKHQVERLQQQEASGYIGGTLRGNSLCTVVSFSYHATIGARVTHLSAKLLYGDVTGVLPTQAHITCSGADGASEDAVSAHAALFRSTPLHRALQSFAS